MGAYLRCSWSAFPSGSRKVARWQTPESIVSCVELDALRLELLPRLLDVGHAQRDRHLMPLRLEVEAQRLGRYERQAGHVAELVLDPARA